MSGALSFRIVICYNDCPIGPRLERATPLPKYQHTYADTDEGRAQAQQDMEKMHEYIQRHHTNGKHGKSS